MYRWLISSILGIILSISTAFAQNCIQLPHGYPWAPGQCLNATDLNNEFASILSQLNNVGGITWPPNGQVVISTGGSAPFGVPYGPSGPSTLLQLNASGFVNNGVLSGVPNSSLASPFFTLNGHSITLGGTDNLSFVDILGVVQNNQFPGTLPSGLVAPSLVINGTPSITGLPNPTNPLDAATKSYVDATASGVNLHTAVAAATTPGGGLPNGTPVYNNGSSGVGATLTSGAAAAFAIDGYSASVNDRILVKDASTAAWNGIYIVTTVGNGSTNWVLTRATDFNTATTGNIALGAQARINNGTINANSLWQLGAPTPSSITVGTTALTFNFLSTAAVYTADETSLHLASGVFSAKLIPANAGGTGVNNGSNTATLGGNLVTGGALTTAAAFTTSGAFGLTLTVTGTTNVTLPTSGTLFNNSRTVSTTAPLSGGGDMSANRSLVLNYGAGLAIDGNSNFNPSYPVQAAKTSSYAVAGSDFYSVVQMNCAAACTVTMPTIPVSGAAQQAPITIKNIGTGPVTISSASTFDGVTGTIILPTNLRADFRINGSNHYQTDIVSNVNPGGSNTWTGPNNMPPCAVTAAATIAINAAACASDATKGVGLDTVTLTGNSTFGFPSGLTNGMQIWGFRINHGGGSYTAQFAGGYVFPNAQMTNGQPTLSSTANALDEIWCHSFNTLEVDCNVSMLALTAVTAPASTQWSASHKATGITLSGSNLIATQTGNSGSNQSVFANNSFNTGKVYWQVTPTFSGGAGSEVIGIGLTTSQTGTNNFIGDTNADGIGYLGSGAVWYNGGATTTIAAYTSTTPVCVAVDYNNGKIWFQPSGSGKWNNDVIGNQNPGSNIGGVSITTLTASGTKPVVPAASTQFANDVMTLNIVSSCSFVSSGLTGFSLLQ